MAYPPPTSFGPPPFSLTAGHHYRSEAMKMPSPKSPASTFTDPTVATADGDCFVRGSRKRQRSDSQSHEYLRARQSHTPAWSFQSRPHDISRQPFATPDDDIFGSNSRTVNEKYQLAGGYDTPSLLANAHYDRTPLFPDYAGRTRRLRDEDPDGDRLLSEATLLSGPLARERNGVARMPSSREGSPSTWTGLAFSLVGKVFNFGTSVVKGFYAGGGKGYDLQDYSLVGSDLLQEGSHRKPIPTPVPGAWDDAEFLGDFEQDNPTFTPSPSSRPPNKRRQTEKDAWVMVEQQQSGFQFPGAAASQASSTASTPRNRSAASRPQNRRSMVPISTRPKLHVGYNGSPAPLITTTPNGSSHQSIHRRASIASMRSVTHSRHNSAASNSQHSPLQYVSPEAERFARRQAKQERAADKAMNSMSRKMEEMIRQAQQALGTKFSVEGDDESLEDEGFVDDDVEEGW